MCGHMGQYLKAVNLFRDALGSLTEGPGVDRYIIAAMDGITFCYRELGDLESAEEWLQEAMASHGEAEDVIWAKTIWQAAAIAFEKGDYTRSGEFLTKTRAIFEEKENGVQAALAALDHASVLLAQKKRHEACQLAGSMVALLKPFQHNSFAESAIMDFIRAGLDGSLTQELIDKTAEKIEEGAPETGHALFKSASTRPVRQTAPKPPASSKGLRRSGARGLDGSDRT